MYNLIKRSNRMIVDHIFNRFVKCIRDCNATVKKIRSIVNIGYIAELKASFRYGMKHSNHSIESSKTFDCLITNHISKKITLRRRKCQWKTIQYWSELPKFQNCIYSIGRFCCLKNQIINLYFPLSSQTKESFSHILVRINVRIFRWNLNYIQSFQCITLSANSFQYPEWFQPKLCKAQSLPGCTDYLALSAMKS